MSVAYIQIKFKDNDNPKAFKVANLGTRLSYTERLLEQWKGRWSHAVLRLCGSNNIVHYYHPSTGKQRLTKQAYKAQLERYELYIIPTTKWKEQHGSHKGISRTIYSLESLEEYYSKDVLRIDIYQQGRLYGSYDGKQIRKRA